MPKKTKAPPTAAPARRSTTAASSTPAAIASGDTAARLRPFAKPAAYIFATYLLFALILPFLANLTPPGVDPKMVALLAEVPAPTGVPAHCEDACKGMGCPAGWTTARAPDNPCKCICARVDPRSKGTPWDEEQKQKQQEPRGGVYVNGVEQKTGSNRWVDQRASAGAAAAGTAREDRAAAAVTSGAGGAGASASASATTDPGTASATDSVAAQRGAGAVEQPAAAGASASAA